MKMNMNDVVHCINAARKDRDRFAPKPKPVEWTNAGGGKGQNGGRAADLCALAAAYREKEAAACAV